ncbi:hypothetical protein ACR34G_02300 [Mycoplasma sp. 480]|uniref:hypothetical protein n=1 Tax=Mycoplasma sp. 480 TaxID=3440155 RepID=UPI003F516BE6
MTNEERTKIINDYIMRLKEEGIDNLPEIMERNEKGSWKRMQEFMKNLSKL